MGVNIQVKGFTLTDIIDIMEYQIFHINRYAWEYVNYKKKFPQLLYFYFIDMIIKINKRSIKKEFIVKFKNIISVAINKIKNEDNKKDNMMYDKITNYMKVLLKNEKYQNIRFFKLFPVILSYIQYPSNITEHYTFTKDILDNITIFGEIINNIDEYCKKNKLIEEKIYKGLIEFIY